MENIKYWYRDNWVGAKRSFSSLSAAKKEAKKETGSVVYIYNMKGHLVLTQDASGFTPA